MTFGAVLLDSGPAQRPGGVAKVLPEGNIDTAFEAGRSSATPSNLHANSPRLRASQMGHDLSAAGPLEEGPGSARPRDSSSEVWDPSGATAHTDLKISKAGFHGKMSPFLVSAI